MEIHDLIYSYCNKNKKLLKRYKDCTCLYCGKSFNYKEINAWIDDRDEKTAVCPYCSIDSIVPTEVDNGIDKYKISKEIQEKIKKIYFGG